MNYTELSKEISYVLRHAPCEYELEMDEDGWVEVEQLLESLRGNERWKNLQLTDLEKMIEKSEKKRHELIDGRIRAFYGLISNAYKKGKRNSAGRVVSWNRTKIS